MIQMPHLKMRDTHTAGRTIEAILLRVPTYLALVDSPAVGMYGLSIAQGSFNRLVSHFNLMPSAREIPEREAAVLPVMRDGKSHPVVYKDGHKNLEIEFMHMIAFLKEADKSRWYLFFLKDDEGVLGAWHVWWWEDKSYARAPQTAIDESGWWFNKPSPTSYGLRPAPNV